MRPTIALVGPASDSRGGVAAAIRAIAESGLSDRFLLVMIPTYRDAHAALKLVQAVRGLTRLAWLSARRRVDLVHVHSASGASLTRKVAAVAIARAARRPVILQVHGGGFPREFQRPGLRGRLRHMIARWALEHATTVVALTPGWARELRYWARLSDVAVIPNVPDLRGTVDRDGNSPGTPTLLYLGHLHRTKGLFELIDAFARVRRTHPTLRLVLAGEGRAAEALHRHAEAKGLDGEFIDFPGWVDPEAKNRLLASATCFVLPSYHEGLPLALLEAMVAGVPIVATAAGAIPEVVRNEREALVVPPRDKEALAGALERMLDEPDLAAQLQEAARRRALAEYTPAVLATRLDALYRRLVESP